MGAAPEERALNPTVKSAVDDIKVGILMRISKYQCWRVEQVALMSLKAFLESSTWNHQDGRKMHA